MDLEEAISLRSKHMVNSKAQDMAPRLGMRLLAITTRSPPITAHMASRARRRAQSSPMAEVAMAHPEATSMAHLEITILSTARPDKRTLAMAPAEMKMKAMADLAVTQRPPNTVHRTIVRRPLGMGDMAPPAIPQKVTVGDTDLGTMGRSIRHTIRSLGTVVDTARAEITMMSLLRPAAMAGVRKENLQVTVVVTVEAMVVLATKILMKVAEVISPMVDILVKTTVFTLYLHPFNYNLINSSFR